MTDINVEVDLAKLGISKNVARKMAKRQTFLRDNADQLKTISEFNASVKSRRDRQRKRLGE